MDLVYAAIIMIVLKAIWYWLDPEFFKGMERLDQETRKREDQPPDGAIDDYIVWSEGE
jgi:hypothetical protein